jgi:hypothetical protein
MSPIDWAAWHDAYDDPDNPLARRLKVVQAHIRAALDAAPETVRVVSVCAGRGNDLLGVLAERPREVRGRLVELDPRNTAAIVAPPGIEVVTGDASLAGAYAGVVPADLVLVCGVLGRIGDRDIANLIRSLPQLCATGGVVIWTRHRRPPDRTPRVRRLLARAGFEELAFDAPEGEGFTVGSHRHTGAPEPLQPEARLFSSFRS